MVDVVSRGPWPPSEGAGTRARHRGTRSSGRRRGGERQPLGGHRRPPARPPARCGPRRHPWGRGRMARRRVRSEGLRRGLAESGEELFSGVGTFVRMARLLRDSLDDIAATGRPAYPGTSDRGARRSPRRRGLPLLPLRQGRLPGHHGEIWMQPGVERAALEAGQAEAYVDPGAHQGVALVLGRAMWRRSAPETCFRSSSSRARSSSSRRTR